MNRTKIEYPDYSWNPLTGCQNDCWYCYARRIATRFKGTKAFPYGFDVTYHHERLYGPDRVKKPSKILVCSMGDLFGPWVHWEFQDFVLETAHRNKHHVFLFLTKYPENYIRLPFRFPNNCWVGATITQQSELRPRMRELLKTPAKVRFANFEPVLGRIEIGAFDAWMERVDWAIIGALTGPGKHKTDPQHIRLITEQCVRLKIPVFVKDNAKECLLKTLHLRQWPKQEEENPCSGTVDST